jgi:antitoxin ParD1/3/4
MSQKIMQLSLPDDLAKEISASVARGEYPTENDAVLGAVEEWRAQRSLEAVSVEELRRLWREGVDSGPGVYASFEEIKAEARSRRDASLEAR